MGVPFPRRASETGRVKMRKRPHRLTHSILLLVLALGIAACRSDSPPTGPVPNEPIVQSDPASPDGNGSQAGDGERDPGPPPSSDDDPPDSGGDAGSDGSDPSEEEPAQGSGDEPEDPEDTDTTSPPDEAEPTDPNAEEPPDTPTPAPAPPDEDDLLTALGEELDRELARLNSLVPFMSDLYLSLLLDWTISLVKSTGELLACVPLPYAFDAAIIGPAGGTLVVGDHTLSIPAGALDEPVVIVAEAEPSQNIVIDLTPHGQSFRKPVALTLSYDHCGSGDPSPYRIVYVAPDGTLQDRPSIDDKVAHRVTASLEHFSRYAIAR